jgi:hypothetical protein
LACGGAVSEQGFGLVALTDGARLVGHRSVSGLYREGVARRVDLDGNVQWDTILTGPEFEVFEGAAVSPTDTFAAAGYRGWVGTGSSDGWVVGLSGSGTVQWETRIGGGGDDLLCKVIWADDSWLAVGTHADVITGVASELVLALDEPGNVLWKKKHGTATSSNVGFDVIELSMGGFGVAGLTRMGSAPSDGLIRLLNADGSLKKSTQSGGLSGDLCRAVTELTESGVSVVGASGPSTTNGRYLYAPMLFLAPVAAALVLGVGQRSGPFRLIAAIALTGLTTLATVDRVEIELGPDPPWRVVAT